MRKRIAIFGNSFFQDIKLEKNQYVPTKNQSGILLSKSYDVDNYSMKNLSIERAMRLIRSEAMKNYYNDCVIGLGEADLEHPALFRLNLFEMIEYLQKNNIRPILVSLPEILLKDSNSCQIQNAIYEAAILYNVDYIHDGKTNQMASYVVYNNYDLTKAILELC